LAYKSAQHLKDINIDPQTIHSSGLTSLPFQLLLGCSGAFLFLYVGACLLL
jgi:hypothetical protein